MTEKPQLKASTPVVMAADYPTSKAFYTKALGFEVTEEGGNPARFGIFQRGAAVIFVNAWHGPRTPEPEVWDAYFHVDDLAGLAAEFDQAGAPITKAIHPTPYGMDEFEVTDPDGNVLCFGCDSGEG